MTTLSRFAVLAAAAILAGCSAMALVRLEPGKSSEADVRAVLGEPAGGYANPDGTRQLAFPTGPAGMQTYMAYFSPDGRLARLGQVLTEEQFRRIETGTTNREQVERLIGPPWRMIAFPNKGQVAWDYRFRDAWGYLAEFSVMVDERGVVAETVTVRVMLDRGERD